MHVLIDDSILMSAFISLIGYCMAVTFVMWRLRLRHKATYEQLGRPGIFDAGIANMTALVRFMLLRRHRALSDPILSTISDIGAFLLVVGLVMFAIQLVGDFA